MLSAGPAEPPSGSRHDLTVGESGDFVGGVHLNVGIEEMYGGLVQMIFLSRRMILFQVVYTHQ